MVKIDLALSHTSLQSAWRLMALPTSGFTLSLKSFVHILFPCRSSSDLQRGSVRKCHAKLSGRSAELAGISISGSHRPSPRISRGWYVARFIPRPAYSVVIQLFNRWPLSYAINNWDLNAKTYPLVATGLPLIIDLCGDPQSRLSCLYSQSILSSPLRLSVDCSFACWKCLASSGLPIALRFNVSNESSRAYGADLHQSATLLKCLRLVCSAFWIDARF